MSRQVLIGLSQQMASLRRLAPLALATMILGGCGGPTVAVDVVRSAASQAPANLALAAAIASDANAFGFDLLREAPAGNAVISPASIALALGMARAGTAGETATQMDAVMHGLWPAGGPAGVAAFDRALIGLSSTFVDADGQPQSIELHLANASFAQRDLAFEAAYLDALAAGFDAGQRLTDFRANPEAARSAINGWVSDQTNGRIPDLLGSLDPATRLVLVNAIYLRAPWMNPFSPDATADAAFARADGTTVSVPTMNQLLDDANYAFGSGWQAVELPYGQGSLVMDIIVPDDLATFCASLDGASWTQLTSGMGRTAVRLALPRFSAESRLSLADTLAGLGMPDAFNPDRADFSGMTGAEKLFISAVVHQANISVDEKGTEAAAATAVGMSATALPASPVEFRVDRPFLFAVRDTASGAILFLGRITDPSAR